MLPSTTTRDHEGRAESLARHKRPASALTPNPIVAGAGPWSIPLRRSFLVLLVLCIAAAGAWVWFRQPEALGPARAWVTDRISTLSGRNAAPAQPAAAPAQPPPEVGVLEVTPREVPLPVEYAGRVVGFRDVEVRPRVGGLLLRREFEEGARVREGQVLFRIDPATFQLTLDRARAQRGQALAAQRQAEENFDRIEELARRQIATQQQREQALAGRDQARAAVQLAETEVESAQLNVSYTTVTSPVNGVTALESPPIGTLIQAQQSLLTTITQLDPAYVSFSFTDEEGQAFRALNERRAKPISEKDLTVELQYSGGAAYPQPGRIDTAAQRVDPQTGTIQARAVFPNPDGALLPGQFVRVVVRGITLPDALMVPERAVTQGPQGASVFVVNASNVAEARPVRLAQQIEGGWVVRDGLRAGDRVVVDGIIRVRPGAAVRPVVVEGPPQAAPPAQPVEARQAAPEGGPASTGTTAAPATARDGRAQGERKARP
jgi:membrane fusion protein (multidrug efflux system)